MGIETSVPALAIHAVLALVFGVMGFLFMQDAPAVRGVKNWVEDILKSLISKDLFVHHWIFGVLFLLLSLLAVFNFLAIVAKAYNFWI